MLQLFGIGQVISTFGPRIGHSTLYVGCVDGGGGGNGGGGVGGDGGGGDGGGGGVGGDGP